MRLAVSDYADAYRRFVWQVPADFNFGGDVIDELARDPARLALIWCDESGQERRFTFADISRLSNLCANLLQSLGIRRGDRVIVMLPRLPEWQIAMLGCIKLGAIPIPCIDMLTRRRRGLPYPAFRRARGDHHSGECRKIQRALDACGADQRRYGRGLDRV